MKSTSASCFMGRVIYIDCTDTVISRLKTGIQRTVNSIVEVAARGSTGYDAYPVISCIGNYYRLETRSSFFFVRALSNVFKVGRNCVDFLLSRLIVRQRQPQASPSHKKEPASVLLGILAPCRTVMSYLFWCAFQLDGAFVGRKKLAMREEDVLFLPDLFWKNDLEVAMRRCKAVKILLLYDVIALEHPEFFEATQLLEFEWYLERILGQVEGVMTISLAEMNRINKYTQRMNRNLVYDYNHLGHDLPVSSKTSPSSVGDEVSEVFLNSKSVYLMVGTIEPRKNHALAFEAFRRLWEAGRDVTLCIIGQIGWKSDELVSWVRNEPRFGTRLFLLTDVSDDDLAYAYRNCKAVICASHAEGFGLPLVEAMQYGRPVLASDIPVFREIGQGFPLFFPPTIPDGLIAAVEQVEDGKSGRVEAHSWQTWSESVAMLFPKLLAMATEVENRRSRDLGGSNLAHVPGNLRG